MTLKAELRTVLGTNASRQLRKAGQVPATLYGKGQEPVALSVNRREFEALLKVVGVNNAFELELDGAKHNVTIKAVDKAALADEFYSVDFQTV
ncbi:hypothetical protein NHG28_03835 [Aerococcaceae bacterium NML201209]|nr:hypothetical protein [Aerococcaceae bacterium NML201209]MCW6665645.1 hypothetical protein [Aerococcaceae bacterium NML191219]MDO4775285.1 hypothetical protein [Aerococcaceae bacterium]